MKSKKGFTLIELLVVVLIIGILAAIAVPQYQKAVMKSQLHKGIPLVESLYQAQQSYYLTHGEFAKNIDDLDITIPKNKSCTKYNSDCCSYYVCDFGKIGCWDKIRNTQFQDSTYTIAYLHLLEDIKHTSYNTTLYKGKRYCFARHKSKTAQEACQTMGGVYYADLTDNWLVYELK